MDKYHKNNKGFTLVELLITVAIIGVLIGLAIPNLMVWLPDDRLKSAAKEIYSNIRNTKVKAIKDNKTWAIVFDNTPNAQKYYICSDSGPDNDWAGVNDNIGAGDNIIEKTVELSSYLSGIKFGHGGASEDVFGVAPHPGDDITYNNDYITLNSMGGGNSGYIYLTHEGNSSSYVIGTSGSGVVYIKKWASSSWE